MDLRHQVLRTDASGMPLEWVSYQEAVKYYSMERVLYSCGKSLYEIHGGTNVKTGCRSVIEVNSIIATISGSDHQYSPHHQYSTYTPPLNNRTLFARDAGVCLYCGENFRKSDLSRDHVTPISQGGEDVWTNVTTSCKRCNNFKAGRTPEQARMKLLAVPFKPSHAEYIYLQGRQVLTDQIAFLKAHFPRKSPLRERVNEQLLVS